MLDFSNLQIINHSIEYISEAEEVEAALLTDQYFAVGKDHECLYTVYLDETLIAAVWFKIDRTEASFDVAVDDEYQGFGLGSFLSKLTFKHYQEVAPTWDTPPLSIPVVNPIMEVILKRLGFAQVGSETDPRWMHPDYTRVPQQTDY